MKQLFLTAMVLLAFTACQSSPPAPVVNRSPQATKPAIAKKPVKNMNVAKDDQPDSYIVKKGDTLYSISLEFGYDYKELASANNISPPYAIKIGQKLSFVSLKNNSAGGDTQSNVNSEASDGVVLSPVITESNSSIVSSTEKPANSSIIPVLAEPKALREPYSLEALNRKPTVVKQVETKTVVTLPAETTATTTKPTDNNNTSTAEGINWSWPTQGKVSAGFNEATNKGIDIAGSMGQPVNAAAAGKVIYAGSDLRGYGKLVIIKHNSTFLSVYAHNNKIIAKEGQNVAAGQKIAEMGNTDTNAVKLHFEIRRLGKSVDPTQFLPTN